MSVNYVSHEVAWERLVFGRFAGMVSYTPDDACVLKTLACFLRQRNNELDDDHKWRISDDIDHRSYGDDYCSGGGGRYNFHPQ
jgi:hypothetical protein